MFISAATDNHVVLLLQYTARLSAIGWVDQLLADHWYILYKLKSGPKRAPAVSTSHQEFSLPNITSAASALPVKIKPSKYPEII